MEINNRRCDVELEANDKNECDTELETIDVAVVLRDPYWGNIEGDIYQQEDLQQEFGLYRKKDDQDAIDNEIKEDLANEITSRENADRELDSKIDDEITRAKKAEEVLTTNLSTEVSDRKKADNNLQTQIDAINSRSDVVDVVATKAELDTYDKDISINDIVKVLQDETHDNATSYYRNTASNKPYVWEFIGSSGPYYTQAQTDGLISNEATLRENKDNELNTKIDGEIDRAKGVEGTKLDKVSTANKIYGTDGTGAQTTYDVSKLGQVDDVTYNSKSLVSNRVANLNGFLTYSDEELF